MYLVLLTGWDIPDIRGGGGVQSSGSIIMLWMALAVSIPALAVFFWRVSLIRRIFAEGMVVKGKISRVTRISARGFQTSARVKFKYSYGGKEFLGSNWLLSWDSEKEEGDSLELVLRAEDPGRALIGEIYRNE
jgi:hypothetical protein